MIYLNQAATTWPKPKQVAKAAKMAILMPPFSQHRSAGEDRGLDIRTQCRQKLAQLFHIKEKERIYFTSGATDACNRIVRGLPLDGKQVIVSQMEHNAVLRPLYNIGKNTKIAVAKCDKDGRFLFHDFKNQLCENTVAVFINHCSNVTGIVPPIMEIGTMVHEKGGLLIVDASQSAGVLDIDVQKMGIDILIFTGHKGLYGPQGTGGFYLRPGIYLRPSIYGGTGQGSTKLIMDADYEEQEAGTQNLHGLYGLCAGLDFVLDTGIANIQKKEQALMLILKERLLGLERVQTYGAKDGIGPLVSFNLLGLKPDDVAYILANSYDIVIRSGFHCAPLIHQAMDCKYGTVRASVSYFNTLEEVELFLEAVEEVERAI